MSPDAIKQFTGYSKLDEILASPVNPHPRATWLQSMSYAYQAVDALVSAQANPDHWQALGNLIDQTETLVMMGLADDPDKLLDDAVIAMTEVATDHWHQGQPLRLDGKRLTTVLGVVEDYADLLATVSARDMVRCHRQTEKRRTAYHAKRKKR